MVIRVNKASRDVPGGPVAVTLPSNAGGAGLIPIWGDKIPHASQPKTLNIKQKEYSNTCNKEFTNGHVKKKS